MEKINIAELLKDCPKGMELDCTMYKDVYFDYVDRINIIHCYIQYETYRTSITLNQHGAINSDMKSKCVIFPKGKTTWEGFIPPCKFKDGDVVCYSDCIAIFKEWGDATLFRTHVTAYLHGDSTIDIAIPLFGKSIRRETHLATEKEKAMLFQAIKDNGYKWNEETKTLEKLIQLKFKVGDRIRLKENHNYIYTITGIREKENKYDCGVTFVLRFSEQDNWELVPNKFDITSLKPFDKVLVRDFDNTPWEIEWFSRLLDGKHFKCFELSYVQCIPYEGNEHLLGKKDDCDKYFKTWK